MRVGFLTPFSVDDPGSWSGVVAPMFAALRAEVDLVHVPVATLRHHVVDRAAARVTGGRRGGYLPGHGLATSRSQAPAVARGVRAAGADVVLSVAASSPVAYADLDVPVVEVGDATFRLLSGYYPLFTGLNAVARWQGEVLARRSARHSAAFLLTSQWAARSLTGDYGVDPSRIRVAPFGPSVTAARPPGGPRPGAPLRVLFVSSDWARKGGDLAVRVAEELAARGTPCELTVVGDSPDTLAVGVRRLGRVERSRMAALYETHDVLLEPARANAGGVTLTDATVSGLPVVATRTGGVPTIVDDGVTGLLVDPRHAVAESVVALEALTQPDVWRSVSAAARRRGREELSWQRWASTAADLCRRVLGPAPGAT